MNIKPYRVCILCNKGITDTEFVANNNRQGWTYAHNLCREVIIMEQQYAVVNAVREIGSRIPRRRQ